MSIVISAFQGQFESCELASVNETPWPEMTERQWGDVRFKDFLPHPPYSHLLTRPAELQSSPIKSLITALSLIKSPAVGLYQIVFQPVDQKNNWHRNVQILLDFEYTIKLQDGFHVPQRYAQQSPSGDLKQMAWEVENKAHNDKPFYAVALRMAVANADGDANDYLEGISTFASLFQHGGRPLRYITEKDYAQALSPNQCRDMFSCGLTHRPGFLVNSLELAGLVHIPPGNITESGLVSMEGLETLPVRNPELFEGTWIGECIYAGLSQRVCLPDNLREKHVHLIGRTGVGKSTTQEHMVLSDIKNGHGVAVLDPHGDLIERLLCLIEEQYVEKTIYFNPGSTDWIPIWNPLKPIPGQDLGRTADDLVQAIQSFVAKTGWGDRLEHLLRNLIYSLMHLPGGTFFDINTLFQNKSEEPKILVREILKVVDNEIVRQFWRNDYQKYSKDDFGPPKNKLSKLMVTNSISLMLSQPESLFDFREIMDQGKILLVDLSGVGSKARGILGCFILSLLHLTALGRSNIPKESRKQFHIHCDEAHRFMTDSLEDLIAETRKFKVSLSLAHQYMSQFGKRKTDAFSSVGSTVIFNVDSKDASYLTKDLQQKVKAKDLVVLEIGEAIVRIGTEIVRCKMHLPMKSPANNVRQKIIDESHRKYYRPAHEIRNLIKHRNERWSAPFSSLTIPPLDLAGRIEEFEYEEF